MLDALLSLLDGEKAAEVVWTADLSYWIAGRQAAGEADPAWGTEEGYLELHRSLGVMPYYYYDKFWAGTAVYDETVAVEDSVEEDETVREIRTAAGTLTERSTYLTASCSTGVTQHFVRSEADLDILLHVLEHRRLERANLADYPRRRELWREYDGLPCIGLPRSPLASFVYEWAGLQNASYLLMDCEEKVRRVLELMEEQERPVMDAVCEVRPPLVHFPDNLSSDNLTGFYDEFMAPAHRRRLEWLHGHGIRAAVHLDGTVRGLLPKLVEVGFDAVEAITPRPAGDLQVEEIPVVAGSETVILWGGVPGVMFADPYGWEEMERHVRKVLECWGGRPFVLGVADQVPPDGNVEFCARIAEML